MVHIMLKDVVEVGEVIYDPMLEKGYSCIDDDKELVAQFMDVPDEYMSQGLELSSFVLRMVINSKQLLKHRIRLSDVVDKIRDNYGYTISMEYNDEFCNPCVIRIRSVDYKNSTEGDSEVLLRGLLNLLMDDSYQSGVAQNGIHLSGIPGIKKAYLQQDKKTKECRIETDGSNLAAIFSIPEVDHKLTICNDPKEVREVLGIEAARFTVIKELDITLSFDNNYVNKRHAMILADVMTHGGDLMSITRHGLNRRVKYGPLSKCSFEETVEVLHNAARYHHPDDLKGVTEAIIMGRNAPVGTHTFSLFLDTSKIEHAKPQTDVPLEMPVSLDVPKEFIFTQKSKTANSFAPSSPDRHFEFEHANKESQHGFEPSSPIVSPAGVVEHINPTIDPKSKNLYGTMDQQYDSYLQDWNPDMEMETDMDMETEMESNAQSMTKGAFRPSSPSHM